MEQLTPRVLNNRYALAPKVRVGGMADVYSATDLLGDHRKVAVKLFRHIGVEQAVVQESFKRETAALRELEHPNIVRLLDAGQDEDTSRPFIVLEWLDNDLSASLRVNGPMRWDAFYSDLGRPLLQALAFAHSRRISHRDVKPSNVLFDRDNSPRLGDFGIAKIHKMLTPGVTLSHLSSRPYSPPEEDTGQLVFARDVYSFGVLAVESLSGITPGTREDVESSVESLTIHSELKDLLRRCLSLAPTDRPIHAGLALEEFERILAAIGLANTVRVVCRIEIRKADSSKLQRALGVSESKVVDRLRQELRGPCGFDLQHFAESRSGGQGRHFRLYTSLFSFHLAVHSEGDRLFFFNAWPLSAGEAEQKREGAWSSPFDLRLGLPREGEDGASAIALLTQGIEQHIAEQKIKAAERQELALFGTWSGMLKARAELERRKNLPLRYEQATVERGGIRFVTAEPPPDDLIGTSWRVALPSGGYVFGEIDDVDGSSILLGASIEAGQLPASGRLEFNNRAADVSNSRQQRALDDTRFNRATHARLRDILLKPENARVPESLPDVTFIQSDLDEAKRRAVRLGLGVQDAVLVEGPPGTGKTTFIAELVAQYLRRNPDARVLVTSQTHVALDNALERLQKLHLQSKVIRVVGRARSNMVSVDVAPLLLENQLVQWREEVLADGRSFLERWAVENGIKQSEIDTGLLLRRLLSLRQQVDDHEATTVDLTTQAEVLRKDLVSRGPEADEELETIEDERRRIGLDLKTLRKELQDVERDLKKRERVIASELLSMTKDELAAEIRSYLPNTPQADQAVKMMELHDRWRTRFGRGADFEVALLSASHVIAGTCLGILSTPGSEDITYDLCIVDEASKATPTEALVPLVRSRAFVIVGDHRQLSPFQDPEFSELGLLEKYGISQDEARRTLFDRLVDRLPEGTRVFLDTQHRMVKPIGDLISECFYGGSLQSVRDPSSSLLKDYFPRQVMWLSTSGLADRLEEGRPGYSNGAEVREIGKVLERLDWMMRSKTTEGKAPISVAVLTGYARQRLALERHMAQKQFQRLTVVVNTVDAYQGREADLAIYSVTRSNKSGGIGFLREERRLNVALSRARDCLVIVGDLGAC